MSTAKQGIFATRAVLIVPCRVQQYMEYEKGSWKIGSADVGARVLKIPSIENTVFKYFKNTKFYFNWNSLSTLHSIIPQNISVQTLNTHLFPANTIPLINASTICISVVVQCDND